MPFDRASRLELLPRLLGERILVLDGAMGTMIQSYKLSEAEYRGPRFKDWPRDLKGNNDLLVLTQPQIIEAIHAAYLDAGADIIETNSFNSTAVSMADYGMESLVPELNRAAAAAGPAGRGSSRGGRRAPPLRGGRSRPHQPHGLTLSRRERSRIPQHRIPAAGRRLR